MKFSNSIADFLRLEPPVFCSELIVILVKIKMEKKYLFKKNSRQIYRKIETYIMS